MTRQLRMGGAGSKGADNARQHWRTPRGLADKIVERFDIVLDAAADYDNAICPRFIGAPGIVERNDDVSGGRQLVGVDALLTPWAPLAPAGRGIFCNPVFSSFLAFVDRGVQACEAGRTVVFLGPISTDPQWFRVIADAGAVVGAFSGRVKYETPIELCDCGRLPSLGHRRVDYAVWASPDRHRAKEDAHPACAFVEAAKHGPTFPSALYILHASTPRRRKGEPVTMKLLDPLTLEEL